jgi:hypothetical protein
MDQFFGMRWNAPTQGTRKEKVSINCWQKYTPIYAWWGMVPMGLMQCGLTVQHVDEA